jgi:signal transduction histidine kinase
VSAIEAGALNLFEGTVSLYDIVDSSIRIIKPRAEKGQVTLTSSITVDSPTVYVDERRLKQVLLNLLSNGVKFTAKQGEVHVTSQLHEDGTLSITVADTGIGMDEDEIVMAMSTFGQVDSGLNRKNEGTGLGLPLTAGLMKMHGGTLKVHSQKGQGTQVIVTLPSGRVNKDHFKT